MSAHAQPSDIATRAETPRRRSPILQTLHAFMRAHVLAFAIVACLIVVYALVGFFLVPYLAQRAAHNYVVDDLGGQLEIEDLAFNPFTLRAVIRDVALRDRDGSPMAAFGELQVNAEVASLWQRAIVLKDVSLRDPLLNVVIAPDGKVNLARLAPSDDSSESDGAVPRVRIGALSIGNGRIDYEDRSRAAPFKMSLVPIHFALRDFRTDRHHRNAYAFSATSESGEQLEWAGDFSVAPVASSGRFSVIDLQARTIDRYMEAELPFRLASGTAKVDGSYRMTFDPTLSLELELPRIAIADLGLAEKASADIVPLAVRTIDVSDTTFSYADRALSFKRVHIAGAQAKVSRERDGSLNVLRLFGLESEAQDGRTEAIAAPEERTAPIRVDELTIDDSAISVEDRTIDPAVTIALAPISLVFKNLTTQPTEPIAFEAKVGVEKHGRIDANGTLTLEPFTSELELELTDLGLPVLQPYIAQSTALTLHSGKLGAKGKVAVAAAEADPALRFDGDVRIADLRTTDRQLNEDLVKWRDLALRGIRFRTSPNTLSIERIVARQHYARVIIAEDQSLNVAKVLEPQPAESGPGDEIRPAGQAEEPSAFETRIGTIQIVDGSANFADYSIQPSFAAGILELNGTIAGLSSRRDTRGQVSLEGKVDKYAPVKITGEVNLLSAAKYTDLALSFQNMELTTFNPYSGKFAGYNISKGKLSTDLEYKVDNRKLDAQHHIVLDNLEFGAKTDSKDAAPIPIKLAVALLKDRNGVIDLNLPVSGSLDDPKFRLGPIIWKAFLGLLTKIATAPFAAIGALFGAGEELAYVDFPAGSAELSASENEKLAKVAAALAERPQLRLDVPLTLISKEDASSLAERTLAARVGDSAVPQDEAAQRKALAQLEAIYKSETQAAPTYPAETKTEDGIDWNARIEWIRAQLLEALQPDAAALESLARQRAQAVQAAILANTEVAPDRVFITNERQASLAADGVVRMEMKLE